jgi:hypothetical protein
MKEDEPLHRLLQRWTFEPKVSGDFRADVWSRIRERQQEREAIGWRGFMRWLFPTPIAWQLATATAVVILAVGALLGTHFGQRDNENHESALALRYAQSVDPYLQTQAHLP